MSDRITVVAGDGPMALAVSVILENAGYVVERLSRAPDLTGQAAAAMILDAGFADGGGYVLLDALDRGAVTATQPVVMLVDRVGSVEFHKARALGARAIVTKPFTGTALLAAIEEATGRSPRRSSADLGREPEADA